MKNQKEIDVLFAEKEIEIAGETITIKPYSWSQSMKAIKPLSVLITYVVQHIEEIDELLRGAEDDNALLSKLKAFSVILKPEEVEALVDALTDLMRIALDKPRRYVENLMLDEAIDAGKAIYEVNEDFFKKRLAKVEFLSQAKKV